MSDLVTRDIASESTRREEMVGATKVTKVDLRGWAWPFQNQGYCLLRCIFDSFIILERPRRSEARYYFGLRKCSVVVLCVGLSSKDAAP